MTDPHIENYATRIAKGLRHDRWPNRLTAVYARLVAARYGVEVPHEETTIKDLSLVIAQAVGVGR